MTYQEGVEATLIGNGRGAEIVARIADILFPNGDADHAWNADTLDDIAAILIETKLAPEDIE